MLDLYLIQSATQRAKDYAYDTIKRVQRYLIDDTDKIRRIAEGFCKWCWYRRAGSLCGHAFTSYKCRRCDEERSHSNTGVPMLCSACQKATNLCAGCCGDINGEQRNSVP
jgi:hypothetical protein